MIRFIDMSRGYWLYPDDDTGPFAFIDTIRDEFVVFNDTRFWFDREDLLIDIEEDKKKRAHGECATTGLGDRCLTLIPDRVK